MIELTQHISKLLLESDLAIIPGFGGFIAHYRPAVRDAQRNLFIPPALTIGFNDQLTLNDGLLLQSYMATYHIGKVEAEQLIIEHTEQLCLELEEQGCVEFEGIGTLYCNAKNQYSFKAEDNVLDCPLFYGLDSFEMLEVAELMAEVTAEEIHVGESLLQKETSTSTYIPSSTSSFSYFGAVAVIALFVVSLFMFSSPIENTEVVDVNYAKVVPTDLWNQLSQKSVLTTPIHFSEAANVPSAQHEQPAKIDSAAVVSPQEETRYSRVTSSSEQVLSEVPSMPNRVNNAPQMVEKPFHIIVASAVQEQQANQLLNQLHEAGYTQAQILQNKSPRRVSIACFDTAEEAYKELRILAQEQAYESAWVYKVK